MAETERPSWLSEIDNALAIAPHVVVAGNVTDYYLVDGRPLQTVADALWTVLEPASYEFLIVFNPSSGVRVLAATDEARRGAAELLGAGGQNGFAQVGMDRLLKAVQEVAAPAGEPGRRVALAVEQASRLERDPDPDGATFRLFRLAEHLAAITPPVFKDGTSLYNVCFWLAQSERDLPDWFASSNPRVRIVALPLPMADDRRAFVSELAAPEASSLSEDELEEHVDQAVDATAALQLRAITEISQLARRHGGGLSRFADAARAYRVGITDSPWQQEDTRRRVAAAEEELTKRVLGQEAAIRLSLDILMRSVSGLTGAHRGGSAHRPRGVLFFAGPTGVGKTELAKALTELIFGSEDRYVRFDMSEFSAEHAADRLIGSPPGYVGYGSGGELTNAMRRQPFSLLLFDEIEKAHPRILDKFLQILDDGRLTDGAGATVYFSEAILVFTSNAGMNEKANGKRLTMDTPPELMKATVRRGVERYFHEKLGRPELLNRLGGNIVVFRFISPTAADGILDLAVRRVVERIETTYGAELVISDEARAALRNYALSDLSMGGRGIGERLEQALVNPLARHVFNSPPEKGTTLRVRAVREVETGWEIDIG